MKRTKTEYFSRKAGFNNMFTDQGGLDYEEMKRLQPGQRVKVYFGGCWHKGTFIQHEGTDVAKIQFDKRSFAGNRRKQKFFYVPNGLNFDKETFNRISAGSHFQIVKELKSDEV